MDCYAANWVAHRYRNHCFTLKVSLLFFTRSYRWSLQLQEFHLCLPALSTFPLPPQIDTSGDVSLVIKEPLKLQRRILHLQTSTPSSLDSGLRWEIVKRSNQQKQSPRNQSAIAKTSIQKQLLPYHPLISYID